MKIVNMKEFKNFTCKANWPIILALKKDWRDGSAIYISTSYEEIDRLVSLPVNQKEAAYEILKNNDMVAISVHRLETNSKDNWPRLKVYTVQKFSSTGIGTNKA